ncbi:MAG: lysophospholipid acyltransferase family protein [Dehalococcoidia bacterium]|nr:lysophospholipid acyltransferase family protein [Dehalococcoidia bacterium]
MLDRTVYWLFRLAILLARPLPLRLGYWFAERIALICYVVLFPRQRKALNANLAHVLRSDDRAYVDGVARRAFRNFGKYVIDFIHFPVMTKDEVRRRIVFDQWDDLESLRGSQRGIIIATLHFGNWDVGAAALAVQGFPVNAIAETFAYPPMDELVQGSRAKLGMKVIGSEHVGSSVFRALRRGEMLAMLLDVPEPESGFRVEFFGAPALVSSAPARIALRTNSWLMPSVVLRGPGDDLVIRPIIDLGMRDYEPTGDEDTDVRELTRLALRSLEALVRDYPDQWFIFRKIWERPAVPASTTELVEGV